MGVFVEPLEAREFVYNELRRIYRAYKAGLLTWADYYYRVAAEPVLDGHEKKMLIESPVVVLERLREKIVLGDVEVPRNTVIVPQDNATALMLTNRYGLMLVRDPSPGSMISVFRLMSLLVRGQLGMGILLWLDKGKYANRDIIAAVLVAARLYHAELYSNIPVMLDVEIEAVDDTIEARMGISSDAMVLRVAEAVRGRAAKALRVLIERHGLEKEAKMLLGDYYVELPSDTSEWWIYRRGEVTKDSRLIDVLISSGVLKRHAEMIAEARNVIDAFSRLRRIWIETMSREYMHRIIEALSSYYNIPIDVLEENLKRLIRGEKLVWPYIWAYRGWEHCPG